ncbi:quinone oxidoreductase family protein [Nocardia terpenica]|uniref:Zinc-binding dehydrogenase n=1 Tax=Nocardia terpenica TaxID=455432 RepID=A0A6G9ZAW0_9NOCA|nr:zinc-binding alcohol dehydrogenase family protein [Nocardia terpenica]QIS22296.1 zinc-binding dehydrogenase [Nocardia terpenica]
MRALFFDRFGDPDVLRVVERPDPVAGPDEAVVAVTAASVNPSDVKNVAGRMEGTVLPRIPGRDFAGIVVDGPADWIDAEVWGTGGDIGFTRDGSHAELLLVPAAALVRKPERLGFAEASVVGVNFVIGWLGAVETARLAAGETIAVFGVSGGVGGAVAQIARLLGARVIGLDRTNPDRTPAASAIDEFIALDGDSEEIGGRVRRLTAGRGADVVYDSVGGVTTAAALAAVAPRGRIVVISAVGTRTATIDLIDFYHNETRLLGADSRKLDVVESARRLAYLNPHFESGAFRPLPITRAYDLEQGGEAYRALADGTRGRVVLQNSTFHRSGGSR